MTLPPGPRSRLLTTLGFLRRPYDSIVELRARYGDLFTVQTYQGPLVVTATPDGAREIFGADPDGFRSTASEAFGDLFGGPSIFTQEGDAHRASRRLLMPPFHGDRMRAYGRIIAGLTRERARAFRIGETFSVQAAAREISLDVILRAVFGVEEPASRARELMLGLMNAVSPTLMVFRSLERVLRGVGPFARFARLREELRAIVAAEAERRRATGRYGEDVLSMLLQARHEDGRALDDDELFGHLFTLLVAGHETSAVALAWAMYFVLRDPSIYERLLAELRALPSGEEGPTPEAIIGCRYLDVLVQESQRMRPLVPLVSRVLARPMTLQGTALEPGVAVGACASLIHHDPALYPEPERFRPERFLQRSYNAFQYFPYGGGARRCIGAAFAHYEMRIALAHLVLSRRYVLRDPEVRARLQLGVVGPGSGVRVAAATGSGPQPAGASG
jgi:cytochrome P450